MSLLILAERCIDIVLEENDIVQDGYKEQLKDPRFNEHWECLQELAKELRPPLGKGNVPKQDCLFYYGFDIFGRAM